MKKNKREGDSNDDPRNHPKKYKMRKAIRKAERKSAKQKHHRNMLEWKQRRKQGKASVTNNNKEALTTKRIKRAAPAESDAITPSAKESRQKTHDELEIEYLERQLLKNKEVNKGEDLFSTLRNEFVNDGFDEEFLDFLSSINNLAEGKGSKSMKGSSKSARSYDASNISDDDVDHDGQEGSDQSLDEEDYDNEDMEDDVDDHGEDDIEDFEEDEDGNDYDDEDVDDDDDVNDYDEDEEDEDIDNDDDTLDDDDKEQGKKVRFNIPQEKKTKAVNKKTKKATTNISSTEFEVGSLAVEELKKKQMGLLNRISEGNFTTVVKELISMYSKVLSAEAGEEQAEARLKIADSLIENLCNCTVKMIIENEGTVISLVAIHTTLLCALCNTVGINVGYVYCDMLLKTMEKGLPVLFKDEGKQLSEAKLVVRNCVMSFAVMSHFDMLDIDTIFFLIKNISREELTDHIAQILMVLLRYTGHKMKSQNQSSFHKTIEHFNNLLEQYKAKHGDITQSRLRFFEQEIQSFKLSKEKKPLETFDFLKNHLKGEFRYQGGGTNPQIDHQTLLKFTKMFDSSKMSSHNFLKNLNTSSILSVKTSMKDDPNSTANLLQKATSLRLYSNCQKSTFVALMRALDPNHAVERIMDIGFKTTQYTEVLNTVVHSLMCEKLYNEFYTAVATKLARLPSATGKRFTRACVCTLIANIEHLHEKKPPKCSHLGRFLASLVVARVLELKLLKFLKKEYLDSTSVGAFLMSLFGYLVTQTGTDVEEHVIAQLMSLKNEDVYELICELWYDYLQDHCMEKVLSSNSGRIVLEACRRIFGVKSTS